MNLSATSEPLRAANRKIDAYLARFSAAPVCGSDQERDALVELHAALESAGSVVRTARSPETQAGGDELVRYRNNLVRLHAVLRRMHGDALILKAAVLQRQRHLDLAKRWYCTSLASTPKENCGTPPALTGKRARRRG
jgi:hypothetical protein